MDPAFMEYFPSKLPVGKVPEKHFFWPEASSCRNAKGHCYFGGRCASTEPAVSWREGTY